MTTLDVKVFLVGLFLATASPAVPGSTTNAVAINVNTGANYVAFMDSDRDITYLSGTDGWTDGDFATVTVDAAGNVVAAEHQGAIYRYQGNGYFSHVSFPYWYTGSRFEAIKVNPTPMR